VESGGSAKIGQPHVAGAKVVTEVVDFPKKKTVTQKFRRRKNSKRLTGHTQPYVRGKVKQIVGKWPFALQVSPGIGDDGGLAVTFRWPPRAERVNGFIPAPVPIISVCVPASGRP